jgi:hypothetical protein
MGQDTRSFGQERGTYIISLSFSHESEEYQTTLKTPLKYFLVETKVNISQIRFLADPGVAFTKALDLSFDGSSIFGGDRSKRYALVVKDGKIKEVHVEPDNTGLNGKLQLSSSAMLIIPVILISPQSLLLRKFYEHARLITMQIGSDEDLLSAF